MQEFILILVAIFVLFKIFGRPNVIYFHQHHHNNKNSNGKINVNSQKTTNKKSTDDGEYVDYEEIS